jgi:restriction system protein
VDVVLDSKATKSGSKTPEEQIETAYQALQSALRADLLERIAQNSSS